jgi:hypothetical protein
VKRVDFYKLERPVEERFVDATRGQGVVPLLVGKMPLPLDAVAWGFGAFVLLVGWAFAATRGYDDLGSPLALQPTWMLGVHIALPMLAVVCGLMSARCLKEHARLPFVQTTYLFPIGVVDASAQMLEVHTFEELVRHEIKAGKASFQFKDGRFDFPIPAGIRAADLEQRVNELKQQIAGGMLAERELVLLDPLRDNGFRNPFSPAESMRPPKPKRLPVVPPLLFLGAALAGFGVYEARNTLGERAIYAQARQQDSVEGYRAYLARGGTQSDVVELLLPRAELRLATATRNVDAIEKYMASHAGSKIQTEVDAALRAALLLALEDTKKKNSITAFRAFEERYKPHLAHVPELAHARFAYLSGILERFQKDFKPSTELWQLARRLIVHADKHGPRVAIRFSQRESRSLEKNENQLQASAYYGGDKTLPSKILLGEPVRKAERVAATDLANGFAKILPDDLVHFELGPPVDPATAEPTFKEPTLLVAYRLEISSTFVTKRPRGIFTGVGLLGDVTLSVPDKEPPYKVKHTAWHIPDVRRIEAEELAIDGVYPELLGKAFGKLTTRYLAPWLGKE